MSTPIKASADFVSGLNSVQLDQEEIVEAIRAAIDAHNSSESYLWSSMMSTLLLFSAARQKARAIIFRLQALARMMGSNEPAEESTADATAEAVINSFLSFLDISAAWQTHD